jgi:hypothetical protein
LQELEEALDSLKRQAANRNEAPSTDSLREKIVELKRRATKTTGLVWRMVLAVSARQSPCTLEELAEDLNLPQTASVHSLLAILGRPCSRKRLNLTVIQNLGGNPTRYSMPDDVRRIVRDLG